MPSLRTVNLCWMHSLTNHNLKLAPDPSDSAFVILAMRKGLQWRTNFCHTCSLGQRGKKSPPGLPVKDLGGDAVSNSCSKGVSTYCANCHSGM